MNKQLIFLAALILVAACNKPESLGPAEGPDMLHAVIEETSSKTVLDANNNIRWCEQDQIIAFMRTTLGLKYQVKPQYVGKASGYFSKVTSGSSDDLGAGMELDHNVIYYPYSDAVECERSGSDYALNVALPAVQTYAVESFGNGYWPMTAISEDNDITFKNVCGGLKLQLKGSAVVKSIELKGNAGELLSGNASVTVYSDGDVPSIAMAQSGSASVSLDCGDGVQLNEETVTEFILTVPPVPFDKGFTVTVTDVQGGVAVLSTDKTNPVKRSAILSMPAMTVKTEPAFTPTEYCLTTTYETLEDSEKVFMYSGAIAGDDNPIVYIDYGDGTYGTDSYHIYEDVGEYEVVFYFDNPVNEIADYAFQHIPSLKTILIPYTVEAIGICAFFGGSSWSDRKLLESVVFESNSKLKKIGLGAFACNHALMELNIPSSVEVIEDKAFVYCQSLKSILSSGAYSTCIVPDGHFLAKLDHSANEYNVIAFPSGAGIVEVQCGGLSWRISSGAFTASKTLKRVDLTPYLLEIASYNFLDCEALEYINLTATQKIGSEVFLNCKALRTLDFPLLSEMSSNSIANNESLEYISFGSEELATIDGIGSDNPKLREIKIPSGVVSVSSSFNSDPSIEAVYVSALTPPALSDSFDSMPQDAVIYVPCTSLSAYKSASGWSEFADMMVPYHFENGEICSMPFYIDEYGVNHGHGVQIGETVWAPVNCGYHATDYKYGKLYQWGRKYGQGYSGELHDTIGNDVGGYTDAVVPTVEGGPLALDYCQSDANSNVFFGSSSDFSFDWLSTQDDKLWNNGAESAPVRTDYDPCPEGWRTPTSAELEELCRNRSPWTSEKGQPGYWFSGTSTYTDNVSQVFFPAAGCRSGNGGDASGRGFYGFYWASVPNDDMSDYLRFTYGYVRMDVDCRANGFSVRCVRE